MTENSKLEIPDKEKEKLEFIHNWFREIEAKKTDKSAKKNKKSHQTYLQAKL